MIGSSKKLDSVMKKGLLGKMVHQVGDQWGRIQVVDKETIRSLHFDSIEKQSSMDLIHHQDLVLTYTHSMMVSLIFKPQPLKVLCVGLGGGSIPRFFLHYFPHLKLDIVEIREAVVDVARDYFFLPEDERMRIFVEDGLEFIQGKIPEAYDIILIDAYDKSGMSMSLVDQVFFSHCQRLLTSGGVFAINMWSEPRSIYRKTMKLMKRFFPELVLELPVKERTNRIVFGLDSAAANLTQSTLGKRGDLLGKRFDINFKQELETLFKQNRMFFGPKFS